MLIRKLLATVVVGSVLISCSACADENPWGDRPSGQDPDHVEISLPEMVEETEASETAAETEPLVEEVEPNGETYILFTSDVHCGIDNGFGYAGLYQIRKDLEAQGYNTVLVDDGDAVQGGVIGYVDEGENIIQIMNAMGYDLAIPGNHEFDYGMDRFLELTELAEFPYISCNITEGEENLFEPYEIISCGDTDVAFVGVTTPLTLDTQINDVFLDEEGEAVYGFCEGENGELLYEAVQTAVDAAREDGADLVYVMAHLGNDAACEPYTCADVISHTTGIDVVLDGHSHDTEQATVLNADGEPVVRSACGTGLNAIGYSHISAEGEVLETGIWTWDNDISLPVLMGVDNEMTVFLDEMNSELEADLDIVIANSDFDLTIHDPEIVDEDGELLKISEASECNLADFTADAFRDQCGADIALVNGGTIRNDIPAGYVVYGSVVGTLPFNNNLCVIEATGQQILDALEWGAHSIPEQFDGFMQVSGLSYEIDVSVSSGCIYDDNMNFSGVIGPRRVSNVMVGDEPLDPDEIYTVCGSYYLLVGGGDGFSMFEGCTVVNESVMVDSQALIYYISDTLGGEIPEDYSDPHGDGRIVIVE